MLLNPNKNKFAFSDEAFRRVHDAWSTVDKKKDGAAFGSVANGGGGCTTTFWTVCPYCYYVYEYDRVYEECCLRCQNCTKAFHGVEIPSPPPTIPGKIDAYFCCLGCFRLGFRTPEGENAGEFRAHVNASNLEKTSDFGDKVNVGSDEKEDVEVEVEVVEISDNSEEEGEKESPNMNAEGVETEAPNYSSKPPPPLPLSRNRKTAAKKTKKIMARGEMKHGDVGGFGFSRMGMNWNAEMEKKGSDLEQVVVGCEFFEGDDDIFVSIPDI